MSERVIDWIKNLYSISWLFSIALSIMVFLPVLIGLIRGIIRLLRKIPRFDSFFQKKSDRLKKSARFKIPFSNKSGSSFKSKILFASVFLILAVWTLRFSVGLYLVYNPPEDSVPLTPLEELFNSLVHTLQTFSLDEDYTDYITNGRKMMSAVYGAGQPQIEIYGIYAAVLNFLVPLTGGAIVFEIISEFSPKMRLFFANLRLFTQKYYFSELNDNSLALAKDILANKRVRVVFTDAYADDEEENSSELLTAAKSLGAICLRDDLLSLSLHGPSPKIFLIDGSEINNLQTLTSLLEQNSKKVNQSEIFVFSSDKKYSNIDEDVAFIVNQNVQKKKETSKKKEDAGPTVIPVNGIRNMVYRLFDQVPLYEPLLTKDRAADDTLTVTILGSGVIGTEFFLSTYWFGQMLDWKTQINVVSKERQNKESEPRREGDFEGRVKYVDPEILQTKDPGSRREGDSEERVKYVDPEILKTKDPGSRREGDFEGRINYINPEILKTKDPGSELLKYSDSEYSDPYFKYNYIESEVLSDDFVTLMKDPELKKTDYFIVALGSDEDNLEVANKLRQIVGSDHTGDEKHNKTVISYVIYNSDLCRALNKKRGYRYDPDSKEDTPDIYMIAFGDHDSVYSVQNVFFEEKKDEAYDITEAYYSQKSFIEAEKTRKKKREKRLKDVYSYQSDIARSFHKKYKIFSAGMIRDGIFTGKKADAGKISGEFKEFIEEKPLEEKSPCGKTKKELINELAWLEHRRWCAFLRTKGFTDPGDEKYDKYFRLETDEHDPKSQSHKFVSLKLHPCLRECSKNGINAEFDARGFLIKESECRKGSAGDYLDKLSLKRADKNLDKSGPDSQEKSLDELSHDRAVAVKNSDSEDFKHWDYPEFDVKTKIADPKSHGSHDISGMIDAKSVYLSPEGKKYVSLSCFIKAVKEYLSLHPSVLKRSKDKSDKKKADLVEIDPVEIIIAHISDADIETQKPFKGKAENVEMIEFDKVNEYSNNLIRMIGRKDLDTKKASGSKPDSEKK